MSGRRGLRGLVLLAGVVAACVGCSHPAPVQAAAPTGKLEPAPTPRVHPVRQGYAVSRYDVPVPPAMPPGTGATPVSGSPVRGSVTTGYKFGF